MGVLVGGGKGKGRKIVLCKGRARESVQEKKEEVKRAYCSLVPRLSMGGERAWVRG